MPSCWNVLCCEAYQSNVLQRVSWMCRTLQQIALVPPTRTVLCQLEFVDSLLKILQVHRKHFLKFFFCFFFELNVVIQSDYDIHFKSLTGELIHALSAEEVSPLLPAFFLAHIHPSPTPNPSSPTTRASAVLWEPTLAKYAPTPSAFWPAVLFWG